MKLARSHGPALALLALSALAAPSRAEDPKHELRGVFLEASDGVFASREEISKTMEALWDARFNVVFVSVWDGAYTLWHSPTAKEAFGADCDPAWGERDVVGEIVMEAHRFGLEVLPWFAAGFTAKGALLDKQPGWAALGKDSKPVVKNGERWLNALDPDVQQFFLSLTLELARTYDLDGFAGSERFPALPVEAGYDAKTLAAYKKSSGSDAPRDEKEPKWCAWRAAQVTEFLSKLSGALHPSQAIVMAPRAPGVGLKESLQDVKTWSERGLYHALAQRTAAKKPGEQQKLVGEMLGTDWLAKDKQKLFAGVVALEGTWKADGALLVSEAVTHRSENLAGEAFYGCRVLFENDGALLKALADGPYSYRPIPPWRKEEGWRPKPLEPQPQAGSGKWTFSSGAGPMVMVLDGGLKGDVSWTAKTRLAGFFEVYAWIPPEQKLGDTARYSLATNHGLVTTTLRLDAKRGRGWLYLGQVQLPEYEDFEVARYEAVEKDGTRVSAVGPLMLIYNRRISRH